MSEHDIVNEWLQIAYEDYDSALYLFENKFPKPLEIACYHCQQSAEKSLTAIKKFRERVRSYKFASYARLAKIVSVTFNVI